MAKHLIKITLQNSGISFYIANFTEESDMVMIDIDLYMYTDNAFHVNLSVRFNWLFYVDCQIILKIFVYYRVVTWDHLEIFVPIWPVRVTRQQPASTCITLLEVHHVATKCGVWTESVSTTNRHLLEMVCTIFFYLHILFALFGRYNVIIVSIY